MTTEEKEEYRDKRLAEVKAILDDVAEHTGYVFVVFTEGLAKYFATMGKDFAEFIIKVHDLLADRYALANKFRAKEGETK